MRTRRKFTGEFKSRVVLEQLSGEKTVAEACREYDLTAQLVNDWKAQFLAAAPQAFEKGTPSSGEAERIAELEQMVGKLTMQLEIAKKPRACWMGRRAETASGHDAASGSVSSGGDLCRRRAGAQHVLPRCRGG